MIKLWKRIYKRLVDLVVAFLVREHSRYYQRFPNDIDKLRVTLKPGDVVLVEGSQRISQVIKYLTQSSWSHAALYVGDFITKRGGHLADEFREAYGDAADALLVEANAETGVTAVPLSKYVNHNIRICRPINLRPGDLTTVLETVTEQIGNPYNVEHIIGMLRYLLPVGFFWSGDRTALMANDRVSQDVICSSQIAMAFQKVRYPVLPDITEFDGDGRGRTGRLVLRVFKRKHRGRSVFETAVFTPCDPLLVTPRDFDLSPYFEVVKLGSVDKRDFDYKKINWSGEPASRGGDAAQSKSSNSKPDDAIEATRKTG